MRKTLNRVLACCLSVALLVSCCISGLVLPAAASAWENLFPNGDLEGTLTGTWEVADKATINATAGFGGGKAWEVLAGKSTTLPAVTLTKPLEAGKKYVFRFKQSGGAGQIFLSSGTWADVPQPNKEYGFTSEADGWNEVIVPFAVSAQTTTLPTVYFYNKNTSGSVYYDDFAVYEYTKGMNLVPGADGSAFPITMGTKAASLFGNFSGLTLAKDGENSVWKFAGLNTAGTTSYLKLSGVAKTIAVGEEMMLSFRYKGEGATASVTVANANNGDVSNAATSEADANGWKTFTATVKVKKESEHNWAVYLNFAGAAEVLVDDFFLGEEVKTSVNIAETAVEVGEGQTATLNTTVEPAGATIVWASSDNAVATVANGVVTGVNAGTATITATVGNKSDTCEVTVTAAPTTYNGLFPNGSMDGALVGNTWESANSTVNATAGFGGGKAWEIKSGSKSLSGVTLKEALQPGKWYMLRFKQSGGNGYLYFVDSKYTNFSAVEVAINSTGTAWNEVSALFQVTAETATLPTLYFYNKNTDSTSVYYDDFGVYEFAAGVNVVPGAGGALPITGNGTTTTLLGQFSNVTLDNGAWKFSGLETAGTAKRLLLGYLSKALVAGDELLVSFSYKGEGATAALTAVNANNGTISGAATSEADANGYKTYTATIKINNSDSYNWGYNLSFSGAADVLVKDFSLSKVLKTSINITEETAEVEEGETVTLNATVEPTGTAITWTSSDDTVATVQNGVVTGVKAGTATITATIAGGKTDTCVVTVKAAVPVPPTYNGLFPNGNMDGTLVGADWTADATKTTVNATAGFGGGKAWEVFAGKSKSLSGVTLKEPLQPGKWYVFSVKQSGGKGQLYFQSSTYTNMVTTEFPMVSGNGTWTEALVLFQVTAESATLPTIYFYNQNTDGSVYYDNFAVYEYAAGMNLVPGGDGSALPVVINNTNNNVLMQFNSYLSVATEGENFVWKFSGLDAGGVSNRLLLNYLRKLLVAGDEVTVSFKYKGTNAVVKVVSNNDSKAVVSNENTTEADANGYKTYTATVKFPSIDLDWALKLAFSGAAEVLVDDFAIAGALPPEPQVDITQTTVEVEEGQTVTLGVTTVPSGSTVTWTSSDNTVATVQNGVVTGVKAGTATITATIAGGKTDTCVVTVTAPPPPPPTATSVKLNYTTMHLAPGAFKTLQLIATPAGYYVGDLTFTSGKPEVATVDQNGKVTAVGNGETLITVASSLGSDFTKTCLVKVSEFGDIMIGGDFEADNDNYNWSNYTAAIGQVVVDPANAQNHVLSMNSKKSAWYRFDGLLKGNTIYRLRGKAKGDVKAQVLLNGVSKLISGQTRGEFYPIEAGDDVSQWKEFDVVFLTAKEISSNYFIAFKNDGEGEVYFDDIRVEHVTLPITSLIMNEKIELGVGVTSYINYKYDPFYGDVSTLQWTSSDASVATVDSQGKVTTLKEGNTTITLKASDTVYATCVVKVVKDAKSFALSKQELSLLPGGGATLYVKAEPVGAVIGGTLSFSSSDNAVATVDQNGNVTAVANGSATITCTNGEVSATCVVTVSENGELIVGGDFQGNTQNWGAVADGTNAAIVDDLYEFGNKVLVVNPEKTTGAYANLTLQADTLYMLTLRAKGQAATVNINSAIVEKFFPADASLKTVADAMNWNTFTIRFRTKAAGTLSDVLSFVGGKDTVTYIDDVSLVKLPTMTGIAWQYQDGDTVYLAPDNSAQLSVAPVPSNGYLEAPIVWSVADPMVASVDQNGLITAAKEGTTTVTASVDGFAAITLKVVVNYYKEVFFDGNFANPNAYWKPLRDDMQFEGGITAGIGDNGSNGFAVLGKHSTYYKGPTLKLVPGNKYTLTVKYKSNINPHGAQYVWYEPIGQINFENTKGKWKTKTITGTINPAWYPHTYQMCIASTSLATEADGIVIDSIEVKMVDTGVDADLIGISPADKQLLPGEIMSYILTADPSNANTNFMTWTSSNEDVATVEFGKVYALGAGTATITAAVPTSDGGVKTATATITVIGDEALIKNGTFDKAGDNSWQLNGASIVTGFNKTNGAQLDSTDESITQALTNIKAGATYSLRFRHSGNDTRKVKAYIKGANSSTVYFEKEYTTNSAWNETKTEFTIPVDYNGEDVVFQMVATGSRGTITVDCISLTEGFSKADIIASDIVWNDGATQIKPGTPLNFTAVIGNVGEENTKETQDIVVELRVNAQTIYTWTHKGGIKAGDFVALTTDEPWIAEKGEHVFSIHVNTTGSVRESNNKNNGIQGHARVAEEFLEAPQEALNGGFNKLVFSDDFDVLSVDSEYTADYGYKWYLTDQTGVTGDMSDLIKTEDGVILAGKRMRYNWLLSTIDGETGAGWQGFTFGYLEYRTRFERTPNVETQTIKGSPAVWSFSHENIAPHVFGDPGRTVEVDWMEYWGNKYANGTWTVTLHDSVGDYNKQNMNNNPNHFVKGSYDENDIGDGEWHTVGYRWEKGLMICYLDGREVWRQEWGGPDGPNPPANVGAGEYRDDVFTFTDKQTLALLLAGGVQHPMEIDYIRVWQSDGTIDAKPVLNSTFLEDHLTDENGEYFLEVTPDNYQNILDALFAWEELSDEQRDAVNNVLKELGGKTYDELLFEAQDAYNTAEAFVAFYACDEFGDAYTDVDETNFEWILSSAEEWENFGELERAIINDLAKELCGMTFEELFARALAFGEDGEVPSPEDGVPFPLAALVGLALGGSAMIVGRKRRDDEE